MNNLSKVLATMTMPLAIAGMANASELVAADNSVSTKLCMAASQSSRITMLNAIKGSGLSKSYIIYNVKCNDQNITDFVALHGKSPIKMTTLLNQGRNKGHVTINDIASL